MATERTRVYPTALQVGERIARIRTLKGWTQRELARQADYSFQQVSKVEAGELNTPVETLFRLARALDVPLAALFDILTEEVALVEAAQLCAASLPKIEEAHDEIQRALAVLRGTVTPQAAPPEEESDASPFEDADADLYAFAS